MSAKLYPLHRKVESKKRAKNRCEVCDYVTDTDTFASTVSGESFKINHQLNYDGRCIIYLLTCKQFQREYIRETKDDFRYLDIDGTITSPALENLIGKILACKSTFIDTLVVKVTGDSLMIYQLHSLTKRMGQTLKNGKTTG